MDIYVYEKKILLEKLSAQSFVGIRQRNCFSFHYTWLLALFGIMWGLVNIRDHFQCNLCSASDADTQSLQQLPVSMDQMGCH